MEWSFQEKKWTRIPWKALTAKALDPEYAKVASHGNWTPKTFLLSLPRGNFS
jgi:hypothetical protein